MTHFQVRVLVLTAMLFLVAGQLWAVDPSFVQFTLSACRNDGSITLPNSQGQFICPDAAYTTGNLGKGWNELDLVPHRLTTSLGNQSTATTDYNVYVAADYQTSGRIGYDVISSDLLVTPEVNATKSHASCSATWGAQSTQGTAANPFGGGTDTVVYRLLTIHQEKGTTCVFDYYQRLALGAHLYPGSSLQSYMFDQEGLSGGKKTISIPVNQIQPQSLSKNMTATEGTDHQWTLSKTPTPATVSFPNTCDPSQPNELPVSISVVWVRGPADPSGNVTVTTYIYATNPAARTITTCVTDAIYSGTSLLDTSSQVCKDVPANTAGYLITSHQITVSSTASNLNDVATATYTDLVTGIPVPGTTTATASAEVQLSGPELNQSAIITDVESLANTNFAFAVTSFDPLLGGFEGGYNLGDFTNGPLTWSSGSQGDSGFVTFSKSIKFTAPTADSASVLDNASLAGSDGASATASGTISISANAYGTINVIKHLNVPLPGSVPQTFTIHLVDGGGQVQASGQVTLSPGQQDSAPFQFQNVLPGSYTVTEDTLAGFAPLAPVPVNLTLPSCSNTVTIENTLAGQDLTVTKTATSSFDRTYLWQITKSVDQSHFDGPANAVPNYTVTVSQTGFTDSNAKVSGTITVSNPNFYDVAGVNITDTLPGFSCTVVGGSNLTVPANGSASASYDCTGGSGSAGTNTATAVVSDPSAYGLPSGSATATAGYDFAGVAPSSVTNKVVHVTDTLGGALGTVTATDSQPFATATFTYPHTFQPPASGCTSFPNTATITETGQTANASVEVCQARIILVKLTRGGVGTFTFPVNGPTTVLGSITTQGTPDGSGQQIIPAAIGSYTTQENPTQGWLLTDFICDAGAATQMNPLTGIPAVWGFTLPSGGTVTCTFTNSANLTTRTQGFWATHTVLANNVWNGVIAPVVVGTPESYLCGVPITAQPFAGQNQLMGGFWSSISKTSTNQPRKAIDQARMQMLQQYLAAVLNVHMFGGDAGMLANARSAYCTGNAAQIQNQIGILGAYNNSGDNSNFTPGMSATSKDSRAQANIAFWNTTIH